MLVVLLGSLLLSCTEVIPNSEVCADKGALGATCAWTRSGPDRSMGFLQWQKERVGYFCMSAKDFGKYQQFIQDACAKHQDCIDRVNNFVQKLQGGSGGKD